MATQLKTKQTSYGGRKAKHSKYRKGLGERRARLPVSNTKNEDEKESAAYFSNVPIDKEIRDFVLDQIPDAIYETNDKAIEHTQKVLLQIAGTMEISAQKTSKNDWYVPIPSNLLEKEARYASRKQEIDGKLMTTLEFMTRQGILKRKNFSIPQHLCREYRFADHILDKLEELKEAQILRRKAGQKATLVHLQTGRKVSSRVLEGQKVTQRGSRIPQGSLLALQAMKPLTINIQRAEEVKDQSKFEYLKAQKKLKSTPENTKARQKQEKLVLSLRGKYHNHLNLLNVAYSREISRNGKFLTYKPQYELTSTGRKTEVGGGFQTASKAMKAAALEEVPHYNYDIVACQVNIAHSLHTESDIPSKALKKYINDPKSKNKHAEALNLTTDEWKVCFYPVLMGADLSENEYKDVYSFFIEKFGTKKGTRQFRKFLKRIKGITTAHQKYAEKLMQQCNEQGRILNSARRPFEFKRDSTNQRRKLLAHMLQGAEANYIEVITKLGQETGTFSVLANEHDGVITDRPIPEEVIEEAKRITGRQLDLKRSGTEDQWSGEGNKGIGRGSAHAQRLRQCLTKIGKGMIRWYGAHDRTSGKRTEKMVSTNKTTTRLSQHSSATRTTEKMWNTAISSAGSVVPGPKHSFVVDVG